MGSVAHDNVVDVEYKLPRGGREAVRLSAQHYVLTARQGYLLHPTINQAIRDIRSPRIADVATGTAIWAMELAQQMPHAEIVGLDITDQQFPPELTLPSNVALGLYNLLEDVPLRLQGQFDIVHIRLLLTAGPGVDKQIFIDRFCSLLRPGGWLQWDELCFPNLVKCSPLPSGQVTVEHLLDHPLMDVSKKYLKVHDRLEWISQFPEVMDQAGGFKNAQRQLVRVLPHLLQMETDLCVAVKTDFLNMLMQTKKVQDPAAVEELKAALAALYADVANGMLLSYHWNVCTAQKS